MDTPYITVTLEVSGYEEQALLDLHANLRDILRAWKPMLEYGDLTITFADRDPLPGGSDTAELALQHDDA